jgi:hypothetical protein
VTGRASSARTDRVVERRTAVALARHYRGFEALSITQIAERLGRSSATVKGYLYDPTGEKARAVKASERRWTHERVVAAMLDWRRRYGRLPTSYDWSGMHARLRGGAALERLARGEWPSACVVGNLFGTWAAARRRRPARP